MEEPKVIQTFSFGNLASKRVHTKVATQYMDYNEKRKEESKIFIQSILPSNSKLCSVDTMTGGYRFTVHHTGKISNDFKKHIDKKWGKLVRIETENNQDIITLKDDNPSFSRIRESDYTIFYIIFIFICCIFGLHLLKPNKYPFPWE